jgi:hypothetical protein
VSRLRPRPGPWHRHLPRDLDPALAARTGGGDHGRRRLGHHGGVRRHRQDRFRRVAGRAAGGYHQGVAQERASILKAMNQAITRLYVQDETADGDEQAA